jgi:drug/metabolite transporter (DMT)-like permease
MALFAKEAYRSGVSVTTLLALRFTLAAAAFWAIVAVRRRAAVRRPPGRLLLAGLGLGAVGYAAQAGAYFAALTHIEASLTSLLTYLYPALVFAGAVALGRERSDRRRALALALATAGAALVLAAGGTGALDPIGVALAFGAAVSYATYILVADRLGTLDPFVLSALVMTGATATTWTFGLTTGSLQLGFAAGGWLWIVALTLICTVVAVSAFLVGMALVGPATASIVSTIEPLVTVASAMAIFGERLGPLQAVGGALVVGAVVLMQAKVRRRDSAAHASAAAPARAFA